MKKLFLILTGLIFVQNISFAQYETFYFNTGDKLLYGLKNEKEKVIVKPAYREIYKSNGNYIFKHYPQYKSVYTLSGVNLLNIEDSSIEYYDNDFVVIKDEKGYYLADNLGQRRSKHYTYIQSNPYNKNYMLLSDLKYKTMGVMNKKGKVIIPVKNNYNWYFAFSNDDKIFVKNEKKNKYYIIEETGKKTLTDEQTYENAVKKQENDKDKPENKKHFYSKYFTEKDNGYLYGIDEDREVAVEPKYEDISVEAGKNVIFFTYKENDKWGVKTISDEKVILKPCFNQPIKIINNFILEETGLNASYYDEKFNKQFDLYNMSINSDYSEGLAVVSKHIGNQFKYGYIDKNVNVVIDFQFEYANPFIAGKALVKQSGEEFYIDKQGNRIAETWKSMR